MKYTIEVEAVGHSEGEARGIKYTILTLKNDDESTELIYIPQKYINRCEFGPPDEGPGYYKITLANGVKEVVYRNNSNHWYHTGEITAYRWNELGNVVNIKKLEL